MYVFKRKSTVLLLKFIVFSLCLSGLNRYIHTILQSPVSIHALSSEDILQINALQEQTKQYSENSKNKKIYIYSTHQQENYLDSTTFNASHDFAENLRQLGYEVKVEENDFTAYAKSQGLTYDDLYQVSNHFLQETLSEGTSLALIIDFHRDSVGKDVTSLHYGNQDYAKMMFVVGGLSSKAEQVKSLSAQLSSSIDQMVPGISRGIFVREAYYNQEMADNMVLIEVGGVENRYEEVKNSVSILAKAIDQWLSS